MNTLSPRLKQRQIAASLSAPTIGLFSVLLLMLFAPLPVAAGGTVGTCDQSSLDAALAGGGTVTFTTGSCTIAVTSQKTITAETTIDGGGVITLSGGDATRVFTVSNGITLTLANLT